MATLLPATPGLFAGTLDRRVVLLRPDFNEFGDEIIGYTPVATVWAAIAPRFGTEADQSARIVAAVDVYIYIRYRKDLDPRYRIRDRDKEYEIRAMADIMRRHIQWALTCREVE